VTPDPTQRCGPYAPVHLPMSAESRGVEHVAREPNQEIGRFNHDTVAMVVLDSSKKMAAGTSTNGSRNKIPGRVGDSPIMVLHLLFQRFKRPCFRAAARTWTTTRVGVARQGMAT
jgi:hypothetical protein